MYKYIYASFSLLAFVDWRHVVLQEGEEVAFDCIDVLVYTKLYKKVKDKLQRVVYLQAIASGLGLLQLKKCFHEVDATYDILLK